MSYKVLALQKSKSNSNSWINMYASADINVLYRWLEKQLAEHKKACGKYCMYGEWKVVDS